MGFQDNAQICLNGHIITSFAGTQPESTQDYCDKCGATTISECTYCNAAIKGGTVADHFMGYSSSLRKPPTYCPECGKPYPWTESKLTDNETRNNAGQLNNIRVFVASSSALAEERSEMEVLINDLNDHLKQKFVRVKWEKESLHLSNKPKQENLNQLAADSDIFIAFIAERVGEFTKQEIEDAIKSMQTNPQKLVYICLKDVAEKEDSRMSLEESICNIKQIYKTYCDPQRVRADLFQMILKMYPSTLEM